MRNTSDNMTSTSTAWLAPLGRRFAAAVLVCLTLGVAAPQASEAQARSRHAYATPEAKGSVAKGYAKAAKLAARALKSPNRRPVGQGSVRLVTSNASGASVNVVTDLAMTDISVTRESSPGTMSGSASFTRTPDGAIARNETFGIARTPLADVMMTRTTTVSASGTKRVRSLVMISDKPTARAPDGTPSMKMAGFTTNDQGKLEAIGSISDAMRMHADEVAAAAAPLGLKMQRAIGLALAAPPSP